MARSYFNRICRVVSRLHDLNRGSQTNVDYACSTLKAIGKQLKSEEKEASEETFVRTQDVKIMVPQFTSLKEGTGSLKNSEEKQHETNTYLDKINAQIIQDDPKYACFKFDRHSNFKGGLLNSLGIFENQEVYRKFVA